MRTKDPVVLTGGFPEGIRAATSRVFAVRRARPAITAREGRRPPKADAAGAPRIPAGPPEQWDGGLAAAGTVRRCGDAGIPPANAGLGAARPMRFPDRLSGGKPPRRLRALRAPAKRAAARRAVGRESRIAVIPAAGRLLTGPRALPPRLSGVPRSRFLHRREPAP
jgi:hypothetical protein